MAYVLRYELGYNSLETTGKISIYENDWSGGSETLTLKSNSLKIRYNWGGWENPIIGLTASFSVENEKDDFFELLPLLTADEREYKVVIERITPSALTFFEGFLNCEDNEQKYLHYQAIRLNASSYLSKLQYVDPPIVEDLENDTFINIIDDCLTQTGTSDDIHVNCSLYPVGSFVDTTTTLFNKCGVYKEVFWKNNIDRDSALDVIKKILSSFDCYIMWINGDWYIERYADIWRDSSVDYVRYTTGTEYWPGDTGTSVNVTPNVYDFVDQDKMEMTQTIKMLAGQKQVEINIEHRNTFNFVNNDYANATEDDPLPANPGRRQWILWTDGSGLTWPEVSFGGILAYGHGDPFRDIEKSVFRSGYEPDSSGLAVAGAAVWLGNFTKFRVTVTNESVLTIRFKFGAGNDPFYLLDAGASGPEDFNIRFFWYLRNSSGGIGDYVIYNEVSEEWEISTYSNQAININGAELDPELWTTEVTLSIALHQAYSTSWGGDQDFVLCLGTPIIERPTQPDIVMAGDYRGDVVITMNSTLVDNYVSGEINTNFLNKKTLTQHLTDANDLGIQNGIFYGDGDTDAPDDLDVRTSIWDDELGSSGEGLELVEMKLKDKFRLYNVSRQIITVDLKTTFGWRPFQRFTDSNQADSTGGEGKHFLVLGTTYMPQEDRCSTQLCEYDVEEDINLV
jgi:hypothetical protein